MNTAMWRRFLFVLLCVCFNVNADEDIQERTIYVPKCCGLNENINNNDGKCEIFEEPLHFQPYFTDLPDFDRNLSNSEVKVGNPCASGRYRLEPHKISFDEFALYSNGSLSVPEQFYGFKEIDEYCLESFIIEGQVIVLPLLCFTDVYQMEEEEEYLTKLQYFIYPIGMITSTFFLSLTSAAYLCVPALRNTHGRALALHAASLAVAYLSLAIAQLGGTDLLGGHFCVPIAFIIQYSFVTSFFWLNVICFDLWRRMRNISLKNEIKENVLKVKAKENGLEGKTKVKTGLKIQINEKKKRKHLLVFYCIYAYCFPLMLTLVTLFLDLGPTIPEFTKPNIGDKSCWFGTDKAALPYFYGPMVLLIIINIFFVSLSLKKLILVCRKKQLPPPYPNNLYCLIFVLILEMGLTWIMEFVSWWLETNSTIWICIDLLNVLLGIFIFVVFVLESRVIGILRNEWKRVRTAPNSPRTPNDIEKGPNSLPLLSHLP